MCPEINRYENYGPVPKKVGLNSHKHLQHGGRTERLPEKLLRAGDREGEALYSISLENVYRWLRAEITAAFGTGRRCEERRADQIAAAAWCRARDLVRLRAKPECPLVSWTLCSRLHVQSRILIVTWRWRIRPRTLGATASLLDATAASANRMKAKDYRKGDGGAHVIRAADLALSDCTCGLMVARIERCIIVGAEGRAVVLESCSLDRGDS
jgi:hypothetical protein